METPSHGGHTEDGPLAAENAAHDGSQPKRQARGQGRGRRPIIPLVSRRKAKCSRDQPCSSCLKLGIDCVYDQEKSKPGMRTGAIESLNERVGESLWLPTVNLTPHLFNVTISHLDSSRIGKHVCWPRSPVAADLE
ncbi:hypothetical protein EDB81DRAFT_31452 [Dactylonectria macrodidyma]|uniref:Zn(2)-C6 fungal-type domain-containing protein n=1 Tax=Dactylonectria macrodidyma TaxID=307937 RepID=A0A9P9FUZ4_9HYPO|nr:hypothetical protein EDB81DRAFT_31452 [Dactylonectria macrodidyma]